MVNASAVFNIASSCSQRVDGNGRVGMVSAKGWEALSSDALSLLKRDWSCCFFCGRLSGGSGNKLNLCQFDVW